MNRSAEIEYEQMLLARHSLVTVNRQHLLERSAYILLCRIEVQGRMSISELSEALGLDVSTLNRQTAAAMRAGLLERIADPDGGIARKFVITQQGSELLVAQRSMMRNGLDKLMADWSDEEIADFGAFLRRFNMDIERHTGRIWPRP
ncbi:MarR family winged helix-turn-helix transcriptional regulator [Kineosporia mesophila]|uniref:MarR family winged helix-turn-helix transcriptional regulator n=1 Tax=Kineosporia mesophila TaxID=566012 RepID=A0ABP7ALG0_9ACTN|nr:MarR family transcriptional regulator [Kineosporia mesophila]MCD5354041.1 MarR family transcriptional regulator [Kineosporia mesophila]